MRRRRPTRETWGAADQVGALKGELTYRLSASPRPHVSVRKEVRTSLTRSIVVAGGAFVGNGVVALDGAR
jgi:hypothetical protein